MTIMQPIKYRWTPEGMHPAETLPEAERYVTEKMHDKIVESYKEKIISNDAKYILETQELLAILEEININCWAPFLKYVENLEKPVTESEAKLYHKEQQC